MEQEIIKKNISNLVKEINKIVGEERIKEVDVRGNFFNGEEGLSILSSKLFPGEHLPVLFGVYLDREPKNDKVGPDYPLEKHILFSEFGGDKKLQVMMAICLCFRQTWYELNAAKKYWYELNSEK